MSEPSEEERLAAVRRALAGIKSTGSKPKPEIKKSSDDEHGEGGGVLHAIVSAMKNSGGPSTIVEPEGYSLLANVATEGPVTKASSWKQIEAVQRALRRAQCECDESGYWDDRTVGALAQFQSSKGVPVTGVFDAATLRAMDAYLGVDRSRPAPVEIPRHMLDKNALPETGNEFLDAIAPGAVRGLHEHGVPASALLAMAVIESNWGEAPMVVDLKNVFALKGKGPAGSAYYFEDGTPGGSTEYRRYVKIEESVADFAKLFAGSYPVPMSHRTHADAFANALTGSYSTDPKYGFQLTRIMKQFDLYRFDRAPKKS